MIRTLQTATILAIASSMLLLASGCVVGIPAANQPRGLGVDLVSRVIGGDVFVGESCDCSIPHDGYQYELDDCDQCDTGDPEGGECKAGTSRRWSLPSGPLRQLLAHPPLAEPPPARFAPVPTNQVFFPQATGY